MLKWMFCLNKTSVLVCGSVWFNRVCFRQVGLAGRTEEPPQVPVSAHMALVEDVAEGQAYAQRPERGRGDAGKLFPALVDIPPPLHPLDTPHSKLTDITDSV